MPKSNKNTQNEQCTSETVLPEEETSYEQGTDSEQEVFVRPQQPPQVCMYHT